MGFVIGIVCPKCRYLNKWSDAICIRCMTPLGGNGEVSISEIQIFHINKGGRGLIFSSSGAFSISIGRRGCDINFENDRFLSPIHSKIENSIEGLKIIDAGSYNGIFRKVRNSALIKASDVFICGSQILKFMGTISSLSPYLLPDGTTFYGSFIPDREYGMLQQILGNRKMGDLYLRPLPITIGRENGNILFSRDKFLSATHCSISKVESGFQLTDLNSANGVFLKIRGSEMICDEDVFLMGQELIMVKIIRKD